MTYVAGSHGGGVNSVGLYVGMIERGMPAPNCILTADTGGERPEFYENLPIYSEYLQDHGYPPITVVYNQKRDGSRGVLETDLRARNVLPPVAYGFKTCSERYKIRPQEKWLKKQAAVRAEWAAGRRVTKLIGFDYGELGRARFIPTEKFENIYHLIEWKWTRDDCVCAALRAGLPFAKSACFFCPNNTKPEILALRDEHPDLLDRAVAMEDGARANGKMRKIKGLGRRFSWREFLKMPDFDPAQEPPRETLCGCYDG